MEIYGRGAVMDAARGSRRNLNLTGLGALDLRTRKPNGETRNFDRAEDKRWHTNVLRH